MRTITLLFTTCALLVGGGYAIASDESTPPEKADLEKFVGTWKGYQGRRGNVIATYKFWIENGRLVGESNYINVKHQTSAKGELSDISVSGDKIQFIVTYKGGRAPGKRVAFTLKLKDSTLDGTPRPISLEKVE